jgi:hypothetical protein
VVITEEEIEVAWLRAAQSGEEGLREGIEEGGLEEGVEGRN